MDDSCQNSMQVKVCTTFLKKKQIINKKKLQKNGLFVRIYIIFIFPDFFNTTNKTPPSTKIDCGHDKHDWMLLAPPQSCPPPWWPTIAGGVRIGKWGNCCLFDQLISLLWTWHGQLSRPAVCRWAFGQPNGSFLLLPANSSSLWLTDRTWTKPISED